MVIDWNVHIIKRQHSHRRPRMTLSHNQLTSTPYPLRFFPKKTQRGKALAFHWQYIVCLVFLFSLFCAGVHHLWVWLHRINIIPKQGNSLFLSGRLYAPRLHPHNVFFYCSEKKRGINLKKDLSPCLDNNAKYCWKARVLFYFWCFLLRLASSPLSSTRAKRAFLLFS